MSIYVNATLYPDNYLDSTLEWLNYYAVGSLGAIQSDVGDYSDDGNDGSLHGAMYKAFSRTTGPWQCYPRHKDSLTVTSSNYGWFGGLKTKVTGNSKTLDNDNAVNSGGGLVRINCAGHGFFPGQEIVIAGTVNYNGSYTLPITGLLNADYFEIEADYVAELFSGSETVVDKIANKYTIEAVLVSEISHVGDYELIIWRGSGVYDDYYEKARIPLHKTATEATEGIIPVKTSWLITDACWLSLLSSNTAVNTCKVKIIYRKDTGTIWL